MRITSRLAARTGRYDWILTATIYHVDNTGAAATYTWTEDGAKGTSGILLALEDVHLGVSSVGGLLEIGGTALVLDDTRGTIRGWLTNTYQRHLKGALVVVTATTPEDRDAALAAQVVFRGVVNDYGSPGEYQIRLDLQDQGSQRVSRRISLPIIGESFASCPAETSGLKGALPFGALSDASETNQGVVPAIHVGTVLDDHSNSWQGFALAGVEITTINEIYQHTVPVPSGAFLDPSASWAAFGHGDYANYFGSNYKDTGDGKRWTLLYVKSGTDDANDAISGARPITANIVGATKQGHAAGASILTEQMEQFADAFVLPKAPFTFATDWPSSIPAYADGTAMRVHSVYSDADTAYAAEVDSDTDGGWMLQDDFDVLSVWGDLCVSADVATGFTREGQLGIWLETETIVDTGVRYDDQDDIATLVWKDQTDPSWYFNVANYRFMQVFGTRGGTPYMHIVRGDDATSIGIEGERWAPGPVDLIARRASGTAYALLVRKAARSARPRRVATMRVSLANFQQALVENIRVTDPRGVGAAGYAAQFVQTRASVVSLALGAVDLEIWDLFTNHGDAHGDAAHGDHTDHADVGHSDNHDDVPHGDDAHVDIAHGDHVDEMTPGDEHTDTPHEDTAHVDTPHTDSGGHADHSDHADTAHSDHSDHLDAPYTDHDDHADTHTDHSDHGDAAYIDHSDHVDFPYTDHDDHDDITHVDHDDHADVNHLDTEHGDIDHGDHGDEMGVPPHDDTEHVDTPHVDVAHQDHDDHGDVAHGDHDDNAHANHGDHSDHADVAHSDHSDHGDVAHTDHSDHEDAAHGDHTDHADGAHVDHDDHTDVAHVDSPHGDHSDHVDVAHVDTHSDTA